MLIKTIKFAFMEEWIKCNIGDVCNTISDTYRGDSDEVVLVNTSDVLDGKCMNHQKSPNKDLKGQFKKTFQRDDILYSEIRPANKRFAYIDFDGTDYIASTKLMVIRHKENIIPQFLYYIITSQAVIEELQMLAESRSGTFPQITFTELANQPIELPPLSEQAKIVRFLKSLDDKIEVNRRINDNLEQQAQALFKSWFVDFEPFRDQPFVESELGMIPRTWSIQTANDVFEINIGKTPPRKEQEWFSDSNEDNVWVSIADMGSCGMFISDSSEYLTDEAIDRFNIIMVERNTVLLSFKLTVGRIAIADNRLTTNEAIARFILPADYYREFLYLYLKQYKYENLGSTSSIATAVNSKTIKRMKLLMPPTSVISDFSNITKPLFEEIRYTLQESRRLAELRDTLLPRLMSGELSVDGLKGQFAVSPGRCPGSNEHVSNNTAL